MFMELDAGLNRQRREEMAQEVAFLRLGGRPKVGRVPGRPRTSWFARRTRTSTDALPEPARGA